MTWGKSRGTRHIVFNHLLSSVGEDNRGIQRKSLSSLGRGKEGLMNWLRQEKPTSYILPPALLFCIRKADSAPRQNFFSWCQELIRFFFFFSHRNSWLTQLGIFIFFKEIFKRYSVSPTYLSILQLFNFKFILFFFQLNLFLDRQLRNGSEVAFETHCTFFKMEFIIPSANVCKTFQF